MSLPDCSYSGNSDLYGLGIRLGVYSQWVSAHILINFGLDTLNDLTEAYDIFTAALVIAVFVLTFQNHDEESKARPIDIVIMLYMIFGGLFTVDARVKQKERPRPRWWRSLLRFIMGESISVYATWFWITGAYDERFQQLPECGVVTFMFDRIQPDQFRSVSVFFAVLSVYCILVWPSWFLALHRLDLVALWRDTFGSIDPYLVDSLNADCSTYIARIFAKHHELSPDSISSSPLLISISCRYMVLVERDISDPWCVIQLDPPLTSLEDSRYVSDTLRRKAGVRDPEEEREQYERSRLRRVRGSKGPVWLFKKLLSPWIAETMQIAVCVYAIIAIELSILWNNISAVNTIQTTGQLIPFVIGGVGLLKSLNDVRSDIKMRRRQQWQIGQPITFDVMERGMQAHKPKVSENVVHGMQKEDGKWM